MIELTIVFPPSSWKSYQYTNIYNLLFNNRVIQQAICFLIIISLQSDVGSLGLGSHKPLNVSFTYFMKMASLNGMGWGALHSPSPLKLSWHANTMGFPGKRVKLKWRTIWNFQYQLLWQHLHNNLETQLIPSQTSENQDSLLPSHSRPWPCKSSFQNLPLLLAWCSRHKQTFFPIKIQIVSLNFDDFCFLH